jgi:uncharacterized protein YciI
MFAPLYPGGRAVLYAISAWFRADAEAQRQALHETYNEHLAQRRPHVRLAGSLRNEAGGRAGVLILLEADGPAQVQSYIAASPYAHAGLYERVDVAAIELEVGALA